MHYDDYVYTDFFHHRWKHVFFKCTLFYLQEIHHTNNKIFTFKACLHNLSFLCLKYIQFTTHLQIKIESIFHCCLTTLLYYTITYKFQLCIHQTNAESVNLQESIRSTH